MQPDSYEQRYYISISLYTFKYLMCSNNVVDMCIYLFIYLFIYLLSTTYCHEIDEKSHLNNLNWDQYPRIASFLSIESTWIVHGQCSHSSIHRASRCRSCSWRPLGLYQIITKVMQLSIEVPLLYKILSLSVCSFVKEFRGPQSWSDNISEHGSNRCKQILGFSSLELCEITHRVFHWHSLRELLLISYITFLNESEHAHIYLLGDFISTDKYGASGLCRCYT